MSNFVAPWTAACQASLSFTISWSLLKLMSIVLMMPSSHLTLCHPLLLLPSIFPSIRVFSNESAICIRWPKYWSFSFSISPSNEYSGLISFGIDWFDLLAVQGPLKSFLQHQSYIYTSSRPPWIPMSSVCKSLFPESKTLILNPSSVLELQCLWAFAPRQDRSPQKSTE